MESAGNRIQSTAFSNTTSLLVNANHANDKENKGEDEYSMHYKLTRHRLPKALRTPVLCCRGTASAQSRTDALNRVPTKGSHDL